MNRTDAKLRIISLSCKRFLIYFFNKTKNHLINLGETEKGSRPDWITASLFILLSRFRLENRLHGFKHAFLLDEVKILLNQCIESADLVEVFLPDEFSC